MSSSTTFGPSALATPANLITAVRVALAPVIAVLVLDHRTSALAAALWVFVSLTDKADGWLARRQGATRSGAFLDPLADKILVFGVFAALVAVGQVWWIPIGIMAVREVWMSWHRARLGRRGISVPARPLGKAKTFVQMLAIMTLITPGLNSFRHPVSIAFIWIAVGLTIVSGVSYYLDGRRYRTL